MANGIYKMKVEKIIEETPTVKSFYLSSEEELPSYKGGQFIALRLMIDGKPVPRRYSLSGPLNEKTYRLTIRRQEEGVASCYFHDEIKVGDTFDARKPVGQFILEEDTPRPIVLIGAGVGMTPILSMLYQATDEKREITYVNIFRNGKEQILCHEVEALKEKHPFQSYTFFTRPNPEDEGKYDVQGRMSKEWMANHLPLDADFYFCGPEGFMKSVEEYLKALGISEDSIHYEAF